MTKKKKKLSIYINVQLNCNYNCQKNCQLEHRLSKDCYVFLSLNSICEYNVNLTLYLQFLQKHLRNCINLQLPIAFFKSKVSDMHYHLGYLLSTCICEISIKSVRQIGQNYFLHCICNFCKKYIKLHQFAIINVISTFKTCIIIWSIYIVNFQFN